MNEQLQQIKQEFFALRNGVIVDTLRQAGIEYKVAFGLNVPQLKEMASHLPHDTALADALWADIHTRESRLLAPMVHPVQDMTVAKAKQWLAQAPTTEVVDQVCHSLVRHMPQAWEVAEQMYGYPKLRLLANLIFQDPQRAADMARPLLPHPLAVRLLAQVEESQD